MGRTHQGGVSYPQFATGVADGSVEGVARMVAAGLGLEERTFLDAGRYGSHLLAPTATDLDKYGELNS